MKVDQNKCEICFCHQVKTKQIFVFSPEERKLTRKTPDFTFKFEWTSFDFNRFFNLWVAFCAKYFVWIPKCLIYYTYVCIILEFILPLLCKKVTYSENETLAEEIGKSFFFSCVTVEPIIITMLWVLKAVLYHSVLVFTYNSPVQRCCWRCPLLPVF